MSQDLETYSEEIEKLRSENQELKTEIQEMRSQIQQQNQTIQNLAARIDHINFIKVDAPDFSQAMGKVWRTEYIAEEDGWVYAAAWTEASGKDAFLDVNGRPFSIAGGKSTVGSVFIPVKRGDHYLLRRDKDDGWKQICFIRAKK